MCRPAATIGQAACIVNEAALSRVAGHYSWQCHQLNVDDIKQHKIRRYAIHLLSLCNLVRMHFVLIGWLSLPDRISVPPVGYGVVLGTIIDITVGVVMDMNQALQI